MPEEKINDRYLNSQQNNFERATDQDTKEANELFRALSRQLILVATVATTLSSPVLIKMENL